MNMISMQSAIDGVISFLSSEASKIGNLGDRFLMFAALGAAKANPSALVGSLKPKLEMVGVIEGDSVNLDALKSALANGFANVPSFQALGFTFTESDIPVLLRHMAKFGGTVND